MRALVTHGPRDVRVEEVADLEAGPGQVLVRVSAAGICGSDLHWYRGRRPLVFANRIYGHEIAGTVEAVGAGVTRAAPGDRVGVEPLIGCGRCAACGAGAYHLCPDLRHIGAYYSGGFAEYTVAPEAKVFRLPDHVSAEAAALLDGFAVAVHALQRVPVTPHDDVVVLGAGTIGLQMLQLARHAGARRVVVTASRPEQAQAARQLGADVVIDARAVDAVAAVGDLTGGAGAAVVYETVGGEAETLAQAVAMVARGGRIGLIGVFPQAQPLDVQTLLRREVDLVACWSYATWRGVPEYQIALDLMAAGRIDAQPIITHRYVLAAAPRAFQAADDKGASGSIKVVIQGT
jgi:2-desacetyl-2-hydroxyethyl bacteriochlorophyllide A dehydrogenase